jgi:hypothetical protein
MTELFVGQELTLKTPVSGTPIGNGYGRATFPAGSVVELRKVGTQSVWARGFDPNRYGGQQFTIPVYLDTSDPEDAARIFVAPDPDAPAPRKIGEVPEGMISPEDPRLAWLWEDAGKLATRKGHCSTYDKLCDDLGIPGRERDFTVKREVGGFNISRKFKARSKKQAEEMFDAELKGALA